MGRKWTTKEQEKLLYEWAPKYKQASEKKCYLVFWDEFFSVWFSAFPERVPAGLENIAPELWSDEEKGKAKKGIVQRKAQLTNWYRNHMREDCRVETTSFLKQLVELETKANTGTRARKPTEVFSTLFYKGSETQKSVQNRLLVEAPVGDDGAPLKETRGEKSARRMKIYDEEIEAAWKLATDEQKADVEAAMREARSQKDAEVEEGEEGEENPEQAARVEGLRRLPRLMDAAGKALQDTSGWSFTILSGGRTAAGNVQTASYHLGKTKNGNTFIKAFNGFNDNIMKPWTSFVRTVCEESGNIGPSGAHSTEWIGENEQAFVHLYDPPPLVGPAGNSRSSAQSEMTGEGRTHGGRALETDTPENVANNMVNRTANANQSSENQRNSPRPGDLNDNEHHSENQRNSPLLEDPNGRSAPPPPATISATATATNNNPPTSLENRLSSQSPEDADTRPVPPTSNTRPATRNMGTLRETQALNSSSLWLPKALARMSSVEGADWVEAVALWEELENGEASAALRFSTSKRPRQVAVWFSYGRKYDSDPDIPDIEEYEESVLAWWAFLQPEWRASDDSLPLPSYHPPDGCDWSSLRLTGPNGLLLVMISFAWWGSIVGESPLWLKASKDLKLALKAMLAESKDTATSRSTAEKRSRKTDTGKENATSTRRGTKRKLQSEAAVPRATRSSSTRDASRTCRPA
ncbi:hypothetical protein EYR40_002195 [Pleurotus pulmonarius]|nr:hypothetical protein EYR40_002195 [Pleurotus pulmonarius]